MRAAAPAAAIVAPANALLLRAAPGRAAPARFIRAVSDLPRGAHSQGDPLPRLEHPGLAEEHGVEDAERLPDLGLPGRCQRCRRVTVHVLGPGRERGYHAVPDVGPDLRDVLVEAGRVEQ